MVANMPIIANLKHGKSKNRQPATRLSHNLGQLDVCGRIR
jgi:hypothetical protein